MNRPDASTIYQHYARVRPACTAPDCADGLLQHRRPAFEKHISPFIPVSRSAVILDLGCGYGEFLYFLQERGYQDTEGIDLCLEEVHTARRLGVRNVGCAGAAEFLRATERQYDFISAIDVLEHFPKDEVLWLLGLIHDSLRPGGTFLCQVPNLAAFYTPLFYMDFTHEAPFTPTSLKQVLELSGFVNSRVLPMGPVVHGPASAVRSVLWKAISAGLRWVQTIEGGPRDPLNSIYTAAILGVGTRE